MIRVARLLFLVLPALAFATAAEAGPIIYFDTYRSLEVNGTLFENTTTGPWSVNTGPGLNRSQNSNIGWQLVNGEGHPYERIWGSGPLNTSRSGGPESLYNNLFASFVLDDPYMVDLNSSVSARLDGFAEGFLYNETLQMMLAHTVVQNSTQRLQYQGLLEPGVYTYHLVAQIETGGGKDSHAQFSSDLNLIAPTPVPEPATMTLLATGLVAAWRARRKLE